MRNNEQVNICKVTEQVLVLVYKCECVEDLNCFLVMGLFGTRKEQSKEQTAPGLDRASSSTKVGWRRSSSRIPKLAKLFSEAAEDDNAQPTGSTTIEDVEAVTAPTVDMDELDAEIDIPCTDDHQIAVIVGTFEDDARKFSAISACGNQRGMGKSSNRHEAILKRSDSISLMARRSSIKRSVSRKIARSESRRQSLVMGVEISADKESGDLESNHDTRPASADYLLCNSAVDEVDIQILGISLCSSPPATDKSVLNFQSPVTGKKGPAPAKHFATEHATNVADFEKAYGEDDSFLVEEATRNEFHMKADDVSDARNTGESAHSESQEMRVAVQAAETKNEGNPQILETKPNLKRGKSRKRPPPLVAADDGKSSSDPASDWPHTAVFGKDGGFTTGGFKITSEGMVGKPPIATREDSDPQECGEVPQSDRNLVIVGSLKEFRAGPTIGAGAAGRVYLAEHIPSKRTMAMKVVNVYDKEKRNQLLKELETLSSHVSRYLVRFHGAFYDGSGAVHIALEYMDHGCLSTFVQKVGPIPERVVQMIAIDCLRGLRFLHRHHVLHRDFKTANILLSRRLCCAKLSDFGLARDLNPGVSRVETFVGTVAYMSPERLQGSKYTYASDVWALGVSLVECLLGRYPFNKPQSYFDYIEATLTTNMWSAFQHASIPISDQAKDFLMQCTLTDPNRRPDTQELLEHPWVAGVTKDSETFGSWLDHCRIRSMAVSARGAPKR